MLSEAEQTILLVEDNEATAELVKGVLNRNGWRVRCAPLVQAAVELLRAHSFQAIVTDYRLPDGDPWPLIAEAQLRTPRIPIVLVTAMGSETVAAEAFHRGIGEYVRKVEGFWQELPLAVARVIRTATAEQGLRLNDKLFHLIAANLSDLIVAADAQGEVSYISPACRFVLGYQPQELKEGLSLDLVHPDDRDSIAPFRSGPHSPERGTATFRCRAKDGTFRWLETNINRFHDEATGRRDIVAISRDVTDRKNTEEKIHNLNAILATQVEELQRGSEALRLARERADKANRVKSDFLAVMSHEIRTPLSALLGMTELLGETNLDAAQRDYVERSKRTGASLLTLINDILDLSKIEAGHFELEHIPFDLEEVVERTAEIVSLRAQAKGINFNLRIDGKTPLKVVGDPARLQQILLNLLGNAVKFTREGEVQLTIAPHKDGRAGHVEFQVKDTGIGIPTEKLDPIFEDFTQADSSTTRRFGGTGLGLGIARRLAELLGGSLTVSSAVDKGSTFRFDVPFALDPSPKQDDVSLPAKHLAGKSALILAPSLAGRAHLEQLCFEWGLVSIGAASFEDAKQLVQESVRSELFFDVAIVDISDAPIGGAGLENLAVVENLRALSPGLPAIFIVSHHQAESGAQLHGMRDVTMALTPLRKRELLRLITAALRPGEMPAPAPPTPAVAISEQHQERSSTNVKLDPLRILIADDSEDNRFLVNAFLCGSSYELTFAENGAEVLKLFQSQRFDLVLMDVQMPVMDGLTATKMIRSLERRTNLAPTPVIAFTADALVTDVEKSLAAGCNGHLAKPFSKEQLINAIETASCHVG